MIRSLPLLLLLLGCSEHSFSERDLEDSDVVVPPASSRWDELDLDAGNDALLAAVWSDRDQTEITFGTFRCAFAYEQARYGFWDLEGRLVAEVAPPDPSYRPIGRGLSASGDDAFLTVSADADGVHHAWLGDGPSQTGRDLLRWSAPGTGRIEVVGAEAGLDVGSRISSLWVHADPTSPDHLWLSPIRLEPDPEGALPILYRVDRTDPERTASWTPAELLRAFEREVDVDGFRPSNLKVRMHGGELVVALELAGERYVAGAPQLVGPGIVVVYDPARERVLWTQEISHAPWGPGDLHIDADDGIAWLGTAYSDVEGGLSANLDHAFDGPGLIGVRAEADGRLACPATALLLDAPSRTAAFRAVVEPSEAGDGTPGVLILTHRDAPLLRMDALREGLNKTAFVLHDLALINGL